MSKPIIRISLSGPKASGKSRLMNLIKETCSHDFDFTIPDSSGFDHEMTAVMLDSFPKQKLRVWHIPQVPGKAFTVEVDSVEEGVRMLNALGDYDQFQYDNNIKPEYCNVNGLQLWDKTLTDQDLIDMELDDRWVDWYLDSDDGSWDDPEEYLEYMKSKS